MCIPGHLRYVVFAVLWYGHWYGLLLLLSNWMGLASERLSHMLRPLDSICSVRLAHINLWNLCRHQYGTCHRNNEFWREWLFRFHIPKGQSRRNCFGIPGWEMIHFHHARLTVFRPLWLIDSRGTTFKRNYLFLNYFLILYYVDQFLLGRANLVNVQSAS